MSTAFQDIILKLHHFWAEQGCVIWQPYNVQLGAGTGNPATLLRVLGPEPWRVAYVEPSVRPDDGRYGENPNRMQYYFQYQVILKPDPGNPQEIYLDSLQALGIDPRKHDIRFVEDNWESPALGAWGLGWEVWLDGQEITQFTYFQQAGGINLEPVSVEITYGLERIALPLQGADAAWDIELTQGITYGDVFLRSEIEHCTYYFEVADVDGLRQTFEIYENEHKRALDAGLIIPAYDYVLKCSHLFNVLDTRGAIGVTERANFFRRMRNMTLNIAKAFTEQRESMEHPLLRLDLEWAPTREAPPLVDEIPAPTQPGDFLLEIGVEELPAGDIDAAYAHLKEAAPALFDSLRLDHDGIEVYATPRRLVVIANNVAIAGRDESEEVKGPPASVAFDNEGNPTKAAEGFARKNGLSVDQLQRKEIDGGDYLVALVEKKGKPATEMLAEALPDFIAGIQFGKSMRWNASGIAFSRPIRWIVALFDEQLVPVDYARAFSTKTTRGTRPMRSPEITVKNAADYRTKIAAQGIILDPQQRAASILEQIIALAAEVDGKIAEDEDLLAEVTNLVEQPTALRGGFSEQFLKLPREVLVTVMKKHQRYFAVEDERGQLMPYFIAVRNGDADHLDKVTAGNEHVIIARFRDAEFFFDADVQKPLGDYLERLGTLTFQVELGSVLDKNNRVAGLVKPFGELLGAADDLIEIAEKAARLAKADLATQMVIEMTSLQGTMGRIYAERGGTNPDVANAIFEHWLPRGAGDRIPSSPAGILLALLDRLDSLVGLFAVGLGPTGSADPYALRRAALGTVQILVDRKLSLDLRQAIALLADAQPVKVTDEGRAEVLDFIEGRFKGMLLDGGEQHDVVEAVLAEQAHDPANAVIAVAQLTQWVRQENWPLLLDTFARCVRITRGQASNATLNPDLLDESAEKQLYEIYESLRKKLDYDYGIGDLLEAFEPHIPAVTAFFDEVMVMAEDEKVRANRLALLQALTGLAEGRADLSHLSGF